MSKFIYIASPFSDPDKKVERKRYEQVMEFTAKCLRGGEFVFSPIVHGYEMAQLHRLPTDYRFWKEYCETIISHFDKVKVLMLDGWKESVGVQAEIKKALELGIEVVYATMEEK